MKKTKKRIVKKQKSMSKADVLRCLYFMKACNDGIASVEESEAKSLAGLVREFRENSDDDFVWFMLNLHSELFPRSKRGLNTCKYLPEKCYCVKRKFSLKETTAQAERWARRYLKKKFLEEARNALLQKKLEEAGVRVVVS